MTMTVGKLREQLNSVDEDTDLYIMFKGEMSPVENVAIPPIGTVVIIRGSGQTPKSGAFTPTEDGLIGGLEAMGATDEMIAELLQRSKSSIKSRKKRIGLG